MLCRPPRNGQRYAHEADHILAAYSAGARGGLATLALSTPLGAAVAQSLTLPGGVTLQLGQRGATTTVTLRRQGRTLRATLSPDESIYARSMQTSTLVGAASGALAVVSSDYDSNPAGGSYQCGTGTETVIRVIALRPIPHQTLANSSQAVGWLSMPETSNGIKRGSDSRSSAQLIRRPTRETGQATGIVPQPTHSRWHRQLVGAPRCLRHSTSPPGS
jgi:hypothetical protein